MTEKEEAPERFCDAKSHIPPRLRLGFAFHVLEVEVSCAKNLMKVESVFLKAKF